ncbi:MAG: hypothetical protein AB7F19_02915 [Candidatus Babeliales bacterium]
MEHLKKSLALLMMVSFVFAGNVIKADDEECGNELVGGVIVVKELVGAWVVNATTLVETGTVETEVHALGNFNFMVDGNYVSFLTPAAPEAAPAFATLVEGLTAGSGVWHDAGHHKYKGTDVRSGSNARVKNEVRIQISKCGNRFTGTINSTYYPSDALEFKNALPWSPVKWKIEGARVQSK